MKKILLIILSITLLLASWPASAQTFLLADAKPGDTVLAAVYDDTGRMVSVQMSTVEQNGTITTEVPAGHTVRVYMPKTNTIVKPAPTQIPTPTPEPAATPTPVPTSTPTPESTLHPAYENGAAAMYAFMVVRDVAEALRDDMQVTLVDVYYQGRETTLVVEEDIQVVSVPDGQSDLAGMSPADLQPGDVIYGSASLSGRLLAIHLLYRPETEDIVATDTAFDGLYTIGGQVAGRWPVLAFGGKWEKGNQYAFGVVLGTIDRKTLVLTDKAGRATDTLYLSMLADTIVYVYDPTARKPLSMGEIDDILPSVIPAETKDADGNIIQWNDEDTHNYALVRLYNGAVTDVIVYNNY